MQSVIELACVMSDGIDMKADDINLQTENTDVSMFAQEKTLKEYSNSIILYFLKKHNNNVVEVAKKLDIGKSTIYNLIQNGEINTPNKSS